MLNLPHQASAAGIYVILLIAIYPLLYNTIAKNATLWYSFITFIL